MNCLLPHSPPSLKLLWDYANADFTNLNDALLCVPWEDIVANSPNVDLALANITDIINQCARQYIPTKNVISHNAPTQLSKPSLSLNLKRVIRKKQRLFTKWRKKINPVYKYSNNKLRNKIELTIKERKQQ